MIYRFPREEALHSKYGPNSFSMNDVYAGLYRVRAGERISPGRMVLLCCWFGVPIVNKHIAKQILRQLFEPRPTGQYQLNAKIRFPRLED